MKDHFAEFRRKFAAGIAAGMTAPDAWLKAAREDGRPPTLLPSIDMLRYQLRRERG